jgi:hypothetical protein
MTKAEVKKDIENFSTLEAVYNSQGGKKLIKRFKTEILDAINEIIGASAKGDHQSMLAPAIRLADRLDIVRSFQNARRNRAMAQSELDDILKNEVDDENT